MYFNHCTKFFYILHIIWPSCDILTVNMSEQKYTQLDKKTALDAIFKALQEHGVDASTTDREKIIKAYTFAKKSHADQKRNNGEPYFNHVYQAGLNCARFGMNTDVVIAGLLHDTVEDTPATSEDIEENFGSEIRFLVDGVTKLGKLKYRGRERHIESLRKFFVASAQDVRVVIIKLADRLHNLQTLEHVRKDKQERIAKESIEIHAALASRLGMGKLAQEIQDLAFPYAYPKEYKQIKTLLATREDTDQKYLEKVRRALLKELADKYSENFEISYRVKGVYSLYKKLVRKDMDVDAVYDIVALRIIVPSIEDCYRVLGIIHTMWRPLPGRIKDYIALPKPNGYQSLHTSIFTGDGGIAEIQIRTHDMDTIAQYGIASHHAYTFAKGKKKNKQDSFNWLDQLRELDSQAEKPADYMKKLTSDFFEDRIFVFTPLGDVIDLPDGASVVDFAYAIHSDIGNHLCSAKVNGKNTALKTVLKNRDVVEVEHKDSCKPSSKWLSYVKTSLAQKHIRNTLKETGGMIGWWYGK